MSKNAKGENRGWIYKKLERHKLEIEVGVGALVAVAALVVSGVQIWIAAKQNKIIQQQAAIEQLQALPQLVIQKHFIVDPDTQYVTTCEIEIENRGGFVRGLSSKTACFVEMDFADLT